MSGHVHVTREDPSAGVLSEVLGGPHGDRSSGHRWWTPVRVVVVLAAVAFALGMWQKTTCYDDTWTDGSTRYTHMCYSDLPYLYTGRGFAERVWPYTDDAQDAARTDAMEYPVGISYWAYGTALVTHALSGWPDLGARQEQPTDVLFGLSDVQPEIRLFVVVNAVGLALCTVLAGWFLARTHRRRPWDALAFAASPALALTALVNWDLLAVVLVAAALWAWSRGRPGLTGVLIGLGTATKLYPLFLLGGVLIICVRERRWDALVRASGAALVTWALVQVPALLGNPDRWRVFWQFNQDRGPDLGSVWLVIAQAGDLQISPETVNRWSLVFFGAWCLAVLGLGLAAPRTPRLAQIGFLVVAGFLLVNKVYSPQYVLWLLPLAALARPRWRDQVVWQAGEVFYFACVWWYLNGDLEPAGGGDAVTYWVAIAVRMAVELYLVALIARDVWRPEHDPVARTEDAEPSVPALPAAALVG